MSACERTTGGYISCRVNFIIYGFLIYRNTASRYEFGETINQGVSRWETLSSLISCSRRQRLAERRCIGGQGPSWGQSGGSSNAVITSGLSLKRSDWQGQRISGAPSETRCGGHRDRGEERRREGTAREREGERITQR